LRRWPGWGWRWCRLRLKDKDMGTSFDNRIDKINSQREALGKPRVDFGNVFNRPRPQAPKQPVTPYRGRADLVNRHFRERMK